MVNEGNRRKGGKLNEGRKRKVKKMRARKEGMKSE